MYAYQLKILINECQDHDVVFLSNGQFKFKNNKTNVPNGIGVIDPVEKEITFVPMDNKELVDCSDVNDLFDQALKDQIDEKIIAVKIDALIDHANDISLKDFDLYYDNLVLLVGKYINTLDGRKKSFAIAHAAEFSEFDYNNPTRDEHHQECSHRFPLGHCPAGCGSK